MHHTSRDPVALLQFALGDHDDALASSLIGAFATSPSLSRRTMRELAGLRSPADDVAQRALHALIDVLHLDEPN